MNTDKYKSQKKHLKDKYVRFPLNLKPDLLKEFKDKCYKNNTTPTTEIKNFIKKYIKDIDV